MSKNNSKVVDRLLTEVNNSRTSGLREKIAAISSNKEWEASVRTTKTAAHEARAWAEYGKQLNRRNNREEM